MSLAIAILNYNNADLLKRFLPGVVQHSGTATIYVIDNASTDHSKDLLEADFPTVKWIGLGQNYGYAEGYNKGIAQIDETLICLLNSDVEVTSNWTTPMVALFDAQPLAAMAQPKIKDLNNPDYFEYAGAAGGYLDLMGLPYCRGRVGKTCERDTGQYNDTAKVTWASGACLFVRKAAFTTLGGFDPSFFMHFEEIDLCLRAQAEGYQVWAVGTSEVLHLGGGSLAAESPRKLYYNIRNSLLTYTKNLALLPLLWLYVVRGAFDTTLVLYFMLQLKFDHVQAIIRAYDAFSERFRTTFQARKHTLNPLRWFSILLRF
ncbi:MAG: N-acetylglucosaminyl-diphospho-decaprenol L-rhamnosyltransferase [Bacteroidota bacterium]|nr:MAG: N-acetylglucosaminyl-diphospho-decaprenol L-rhamnosyltransferase [Bacteroidota bacterium]